MTVSDGARCVGKFLIDDHTNAGVGAGGGALQPHRPRLMLLPLRDHQALTLWVRRRRSILHSVPSAWVAATASVPPHFMAAVPIVTKADP